MIAAFARPLWLGCALGIFSFAAGARGQTPGGDSYSSPEEDARETLQKATDELNNGKIDEAMVDMDAAIALQPKNAEFYLFRGQIYARKKLWKRAEEDCTMALKIDPNAPAIKYSLAELKFMQRAYDDARPGFLQLEGDPAIGDLAAYKAYLCDLFSGNRTRAKQELDAFNRVRARPSYFFANLTWEMVNGRRSEASKWLEGASNAYDKKTIDPYFTAIVESTRLDAPKVTFTTVDGTEHPHVPAFCENDGLRIFEAKGWLTIPYANLSDDLSGFPPDMQRTITDKKKDLAASLLDMREVSFTTRDGRLFDHVNALIDGADLRVQGINGWETIPFSQLPADLSSFPDDWQKEILARDQTLLPPVHNTEFISFTTRAGKKYEQVRVFTGRTGLSVVTADGWETIPFTQLPDDLSTFPPGLRQEILEWEKAQATPASPAGESSPLEQGKTPPAWNAAPGRPAPFLQQAQDCRFGRCLALQGSRLVVGCDGAAYVYENSQLQARLCPDADQTGTGGPVRSVALSGDTIVTSTPQGVYVWTRGPEGWKLQQQLQVASPATVAMEGDHLAVGIDGKGDENDLVLFYLRRDGGWQPAQSIGNEGLLYHSNDLSGRRIALRGAEAVVGFPNWDSGGRDNVGPMYDGHAWVKKWDGGAWQTETQFTPRDDGLGANQFGASVAFSGDLIAIGSSNRDDNPHPHPGVVYLFQRRPDGWQPGPVLTPPNGAKTGGFGTGAIALSGGTLAVADVNADATSADVRLSSGDDTGKPGTIRNAGIVYIYEDGKWQAPLMASDPVDNLQRSGSPENFAASLALDGDTIAVGAPGSQDGRGAVYLWHRQGGQWRPAGKLKGFHPDYGLMPPAGF